jgi:hypothetical protein
MLFTVFCLFAATLVVAAGLRALQAWDPLAFLDCDFPFDEDPEARCWISGPTGATDQHDRPPAVAA